MDISRHPHDAFFKAWFSRPEALLELIQSSFPHEIVAQLDFSTLTIEPGNFIDEELAEHFSDLAASVHTKEGEIRVYILVEHKSYHDPGALLQILRYMVRVWSEEKKGNPTKPLTPILPLLYYHGDKSPISGDFLSLYNGKIPESIKKYQPDFLTQIVNLTKMEPMELEAGEKVVAAAVLMKNMRKGLRGMLEALTSLLERYGKVFLLDPNFGILEKYVGSVEVESSINLKESLIDMARSIQAKEGAMTFAQYFKAEGRQEGRQEGESLGIQLGKKEEKFEIVKRMKAKGVSVSDISDFTGLDEKEIRDI